MPVPDSTVTAQGNVLVQETRDKIIDGFPGRRSYGTKGKQIVLRANYLPMIPACEDKGGRAEKPLYRYEVALPADSSKQKKRCIFGIIMAKIEDLAAQNIPTFAGVEWATDYADILVTTEKIDVAKLVESDKSEDGRSTKLTLPPELGQNGAAQREGEVPDFVLQAQARNTFEYRITYQNSFSLRHMVDYLKSRSAGAEHQEPGNLVQMLNIIIAKRPDMHKNIQNVGQNKFYPFDGHPGKQSRNLRAGLEALRGYYASVRPAVNRLLVDLNVTAGAFYKAGPLRFILDERGGSLDEKESFMRMLKVDVKYPGTATHIKRKTILSFAKQLEPPTFRVKRFGNANEVQFSYVDRNIPNAPVKTVTVANYFREQHGITLQHPTLPVLNVCTRADPQYIPQEMCTVIDGQPYRKLLSGDQTTEMLSSAARYPNLNGLSIAGTSTNPGVGLSVFRLDNVAQPGGIIPPDPQIRSTHPFGFRVGTKMITVPGRILETPRVIYGKNQVSPRNRSWNCANERFTRPGNFGSWSTLMINSGNRSTLYGDPSVLVDNFTRFLADYGIRMGDCLPTNTIGLEQLTPQNRQRNDRIIQQTFARAEQHRVSILLVILPEQDRWLYARIKSYGDTKYGIHTICAIGDKISKEKGQGMYFGNLALKFNLKGGGIPHTVNQAIVPPVNDNTMLVGIDVTHPAPGNAVGAPSIACVVASADKQMFQWPGSMRTQKGRVEMVDALEAMIHERLDLWETTNKRLPNQIIVYRDGVSEGQYKTVLEAELPAFEKAFEKRYGAKAKWPKIAVIIVGKRHHTRFYPTRQEDADYDAKRDRGSWNPLPGTVVDRGVGNKILHEFWLQAHQGLQGTARPAHYVVIKDEIKFEADQLEQFTHQLCYLFNRATKAVSICPPAYYADLLCERGRAYLFSTLSEDHGSDSSVNAAEEWDGNVHNRIKNTTWYV